MRYLVIKIDTAAFDNDDRFELARLLHDVASWAGDGAIPDDGSIIDLLDANGKSVGWLRKELA